MRLLLQRALTGEWGERQGGNGEVNTGGIRDPSPNKVHLIPTEKAPLPRKKKKGKGHLHLPWKLSKDAARLSETHGIFACHWADISDQ